MRPTISDRMPPLPDDVEWRRDVNTCVVLGASLAGARKCRLPRPLTMVADLSLDLSGDHRRRLAADFSYRLKGRRAGDLSLDLSGDNRRRLAADFAYRLKVLRLVGKLTRRLRLDGNSILAHA